MKFKIVGQTRDGQLRATKNSRSRSPIHNAPATDQVDLIQEAVRRQANGLRPYEVEKPLEDLTIGQRLHRLRKEKGLTLQEVSKSTGVSASAFSKIERSELSPTVTTMQRIAQGMSVDLVTLFGNSANGPATLARRSVTRAGEGQLAETFTCENKLLCTDMKNKRVTPVMTRVTARDPASYPVWAQYDAEVFLMVVKGQLTVHSRHYEPLQLQEGDSMYYDANTEHVWTSNGPEDAQVIWVIA